MNRRKLGLLFECTYVSSGGDWQLTWKLLATIVLSIRGGVRDIGKRTANDGGTNPIMTVLWLLARLMRVNALGPTLYAIQSILLLGARRRMTQNSSYISKYYSRLRTTLLFAKHICGLEDRYELRQMLVNIISVDSIVCA